ncbi:MAG TPA: DUF973 family protein [Thermoplasmata archaeon]|nr:DUF973 family protein [Thermoplasmata archaeon]
MAAQRCAKCGAFAPAGTAFCAFCGTPLSAIGGVPSASGPGAFPPFPASPGAPIPWGPAPGWPPTAGPPSEATRAEERSALTLIFLGAILLIIASVAGVVISFGSAFGFGFTSISTSRSGIGIHLTAVLLALLFTTSTVELLVILFTWGAFRKLAAFDRRFSTPSKLTLLLAIAVVIVIAVLYPLLTQLSDALTCVNATTNNTAAAGCISGTLTGLALVVGIAALLALIGYIGLLIGLWRLGTRYDSGLFKAGAILAIFPVLNLVGAILILIASHSAREGLDRATPATAPYR